MPSPIFDAPLTSSLVPVTAGNGTPTFTRATTAYVADQDGILRQAQANEARFQGARRVWNHMPGSQNATVSVGATGGCTVTPTTIDYTAASSYHYKFGAIETVTFGTRRYAFSIVLSSTNKATIGLRVGDGGTMPFVNVPLTPTPTRFTLSVDLTPASGQIQLNFGLDNRVGLGGDGLLGLVTATNWQCEDVSGQSNQAPGDYVSVGVLPAPYHGNAVDGVKYFATTNGNSVAGNVVTEATGSLIPAATTLGFVAENAATNICLQSQTFDVAPWTQSNAIAANDATVAAPDGTLTADKFTDNATNAAHQCYQPVGVGVIGTVYTYSVYLKAGTLTWAQIALGAAGTDRWGNFNLVTGTVGNKGTAVTASTITALPNGWYRCSITLPSDGSPCYTGVIGSNANSAAYAPSYVGTGQTMYLWGAQVEAGSDPSSYVATTTVAVVRNLDFLTYPQATNLDTALATIYTETYFPVSPASSNQMAVTFSLATPQYIGGAAPRVLSLFSGSAVTTANAVALNAVNKGATAYGGGTASLCLNGGTVATGAASAFSPSPINIAGRNAGEALRGSIRNVKFYATRLTDAQLIDLTEDGVLTPDPEPPSTAAQGGTAARYRRRRIEVEIDGEIFPVASEEEGRELLLKAREAAKQAAQAAAVRAAAKAEKKTSPAAVERALALSTPRISLRADDRSEALAQAIQAQVDAAQAAIDEDYATARRMAYAYVRQRLQDEQRQRELAADEEEVIAMILRLP